MTVRKNNGTGPRWSCQLTTTSNKQTVAHGALLMVASVFLALVLGACGSQNATGVPGPVVRQMLVGIPLPPDFDTASLPEGNEDSDRYQLGVEVTSTIACSWMQSWTNATATEDNTAAAKAEAALATSHDWPILTELIYLGDWPKAIWNIADAINGDDTLNGALVADTYQASLGCQ